MSLNIKNDETCRLARELAGLTGESMTGAITVALRERLEREERQRDAAALARELRAIGERCAANSCGLDPRRSSMATTSTTSVACPSDRRYLGCSRLPAPGAGFWRL